MTNLPESLICLLLQGTEPLLFFKTKYKAFDFLSIERKWSFEIPWVLPKATRGRGKDSLIHSWNSKIYQNCDGNFRRLCLFWYKNIQIRVYFHPDAHFCELFEESLYLPRAATLKAWLLLVGQDRHNLLSHSQDFYISGIAIPSRLQ